MREMSVSKLEVVNNNTVFIILRRIFRQHVRVFQQDCHRSTVTVLHYTQESSQDSHSLDCRQQGKKHYFSLSKCFS